MKIFKFLYFGLLIFSFQSLHAQDSKLEKEANVITAEAKTLYRSEMASWYGTDLFLEKFKKDSLLRGGYFSYTENNISKCIFFSKGDNPKTLAVISFDSTYNPVTASIDSSERAFTPYESELCTMRMKAKDLVKSDTLFKTYKNTDLNLIPVIENGERKVFILTGPHNSGIVIFGNDYCINFDKSDNVTSRKRIHKNIIAIKYAEETTKDDEEVSAHTHLPETGEYITSTDVCTLMLYEKFAKWKTHIVMSKEYVSLWDCNTDQLHIITKKAWDKIAKDQEKRHGNK